MRYKVNDKVRIKSIDWYNENKDKYGNVVGLGKDSFVEKMSKYCGLIAVIKNIDDVENEYKLDIDNGYWGWTDEMFEGLVEEETKQNNDMEEMLLGWVKESDNLRLVPHKDYEIKHNGDNFYLVKKKKEYPKTYEECCKVLGIDVRDLAIFDNMLDTTEIIYRKNLDRLLNVFRKLLICRDAYWKLYGEEMGLDKAWEPDWTNGKQKKYSLFNFGGNLERAEYLFYAVILAFPTEGMRDTFYENFKNKIEQCKELL